MFDDLKKQSLNFIYKVWDDKLLKGKGMLSTESKYFMDLKIKVFNELIKNHKPQTRPLLVKLGGQSGSGKTTQLLPSIEYGLKQNNIDFIHIAVRNFAKYHPFYDELLKQFGENNIREKTNGFALSLLFSVVEMLIENKFNIFYEITLLEPYLEEYLIRLSKYFNYSINYNILAIPLFLSNKWIEDRKNNSANEKGRVVLKSSSQYFYNSLPIALERIVELTDLFDNSDFAVIWNCFQTKEVYFGNIYDKILKIFMENRDKTGIQPLNVEQLLQSKMEFYKDFYENII